MSCATSDQNRPNSLAANQKLEPIEPLSINCTRFLNVNVHFMQKNDGSGNFGMYNDGLGNTQVNGYMFADTLIDLVNAQSAMNYNPPLWFYPTNMPQPTNLPLNMQFVLKGAYFHRNSSAYNFVHGWGTNSAVSTNTFTVNNHNEINLFITNPKNHCSIILTPYQL